MQGLPSPGDVVQLKSGGPMMTVWGQTTDDDAYTVTCVWFNCEDHVESMRFPFALLDGITK